MLTARCVTLLALLGTVGSAAQADCSKADLIKAQEGVTSYRSVLDAAGQSMTLEVDARGRVRMSGNVLGTGANLSMIRDESNMYVQQGSDWKLLPAVVGADMARGFDDMSLGSFTDEFSDLGTLAPRACPDGSACVAADFSRDGHSGTVFFNADTCRLRRIASDRPDAAGGDDAYALDVTYPSVTIDVPKATGKIDMMDLMGLLSGGMAGPGQVPPPG